MKRLSWGHSAVGCALLTSALNAQVPLARTNWEFTAARGTDLTTASVGIVQSTRPVLGHVRFGLGLRGTYATGDLRLSPAGATNAPTGVIDTLSVSASALLLNVSGHASVLLTDWLEAGLNIDLAGLATGSERTGTYRASSSAPATTVGASPSATNLFANGSKDRGSLNSEFFAALRATNRVTIRGGLSHQLVEYRAKRVLASNTDRFRRYSNLVFVGVRIAR